MLIKSNCLSEFPGVHVLVSDAARAATPPPPPPPPSDPLPSKRQKETRILIRLPHCAACTITMTSENDSDISVVISATVAFITVLY